MRDAFDLALETISREDRCEYVYKAAIARKILLGRHSLNTAVMLTEFRVGACKADVVILNGSSTAYEIKSERDRLDRLSSQVSSYLQAFAHVNVIASDRHIEEVLRLVPEGVGVLRLTKRGSISPLRQPGENTARVDPTVVFGSVRIREAKTMLRRLGVSVPNVPNTRMYSVLREIFSRLDPTAVHAEMVAALRASRSHCGLSDMLDAIPSSLHATALSTRIRRADHARLRSALDTKMKDALHWS